MNKYTLPIVLLGLFSLISCTSSVSQGSSDITGDWNITLTVTESTRDGVAVGESATSSIAFSASGAAVTATSPNGTTASGTRSDNTVTLTRVGGEGAESYSTVSVLTFAKGSVRGIATQTFDNGDEVMRSIRGVRQ